MLKMGKRNRLNILNIPDCEFPSDEKSAVMQTFQLGGYIMKTCDPKKTFVLTINEMQNESEHYMDYMCPKTFHNLSFAVNKQNNLDSNIICHDEAENVINISGKTVVKVSKKHEDFKKTKAIFVGVLLFFFMLMFNTPVWSQ